MREEIDVVDTTDGINAEEENTLYEAIMKLPKERRDVLIAKVLSVEPQETPNEMASLIQGMRF